MAAANKVQKLLIRQLDVMEVQQEFAYGNSPRLILFSLFYLTPSHIPAFQAF